MKVFGEKEKYGNMDSKQFTSDQRNKLLEALTHQSEKEIAFLLKCQMLNDAGVLKPDPVNSVLESIKEEKTNKINEQIKSYTDFCRSSDVTGQTRPQISSFKLAQDPKLIMIDYPAKVVDVNKAVRSLGGYDNICQVFSDSSEKLTLKFRPDDPYSNGTTGSGLNTCGILVKIRRKKKKPITSVKINSNGALNDLCDLNDPQNIANNSRLQKCLSMSSNSLKSNDSMLLFEESIKRIKGSVVDQSHLKDSRDDIFICLPENSQQNRSVTSNVEIQALGVVSKKYSFDGLSDFQYLPMQRDDQGNYKYIGDLVAPVFDGCEEDSDSFGYCSRAERLLNNEIVVPEFILPSSMIRIEKILDNCFEGENLSGKDAVLKTNEKKSLRDKMSKKRRKISDGKKVSASASIRQKRNVYSIMYNFQVTSRSSKATHPGLPVPSAPFSNALRDASNRGLDKDLLTQVKKLFSDRPIWSKAALHHETKIKHLDLKYLLPCVAYFTGNGPWRALWIRFGYDPRKHTESFRFQIIDFRVPVIYKNYMVDHTDTIQNTYAFDGGHVPPKSQMFYQLCDIKIPEVDSLMDALESKIKKKEITYDDKFGFLKEGTFDFVRHVIIQHIEAHLLNTGAIAKVRVQKVSLPPGEVEPLEKLKHSGLKSTKMRIRKARPSHFASVSSGNCKKSKVTGRKRNKDQLADLCLKDLRRRSPSPGPSRAIEEFKQPEGENSSPSYSSADDEDETLTREKFTEDVA